MRLARHSFLCRFRWLDPAKLLIYFAERYTKSFLCSHLWNWAKLCDTKLPPLLLLMQARFAMTAFFVLFLFPKIASFHDLVWALSYTGPERTMDGLLTSNVPIWPVPTNARGICGSRSEASRPA